MVEKDYFGEGKNIEFKREIPQKTDRSPTNTVNTMV